MPLNALFVYGLLRPGRRLHHIVRPYLVRSEPATVRGRLYERGVPAARFDEEGAVEGVILWLDPARLAEAVAILDDVEDEGEVYRRVTVRAETASGPVDAMAYEHLGT